MIMSLPEEIYLIFCNQKTMVITSLVSDEVFLAVLLLFYKK